MCVCVCVCLCVLHSMEGGELFARIQKKGSRGFTEKGVWLVTHPMKVRLNPTVFLLLCLYTRFVFFPAPSFINSCCRNCPFHLSGRSSPSQTVHCSQGPQGKGGGPSTHPQIPTYILLMPSTPPHPPQPVSTAGEPPLH